MTVLAAPGQGVVGDIVTTTDASGATVKAVQQRVALDATSGAGSGPATPVFVASAGGAQATGQKALSANTRAQITATPTAFTQGVVVTSLSTNAANVLIGGNGVTATADGTGNGYILPPGGSISLAIADMSALYAISASAAVLSYIGN